MDETRQSPEQILKQIKKEEQSLNRGHLKIFFRICRRCRQNLGHAESRTFGKEARY